MKHDALTTAALARLNQRAAEVRERCRQAYYEGKADAGSALFWSGAAFGALVGASVAFAYIQGIV